MVNRIISKEILRLSEKLPVITITGPRQSGKTTLVKQIFKNYTYINLEDAAIRDFAKQDIIGFFQKYNSKIIIDEAQNVPEIFSQIQTIVDNSKEKGQFILTGSQNFLLLEKISQSLAGRTAIFNLLPFSVNELKNTKYHNIKYEQYIQKGFYPRLYDENLNPEDWLPDYINTYIERDVRKIINVSDLNRFRAFLKICAGHTGQIINLSKIGNEVGISHNTAQKWLSVLETSFIIFFLHPYYKNFNKRIIKSPKLYFYDTGLACSLMNIRNAEQLDYHFAKGSLFETFIISEIKKQKFNGLLQGDIYFWRESNNNEIDCIIDSGNKLKAIEIKSGRTIRSDFFKNLTFFKNITKNIDTETFLVYGGDEIQERTEHTVLNWQNTELI
ncbi:MAG: ATP-binding protein [Chlorobi bacterium]|nr:ATP-binding protein [Chlorobiota bacterium]